MSEKPLLVCAGVVAGSLFLSLNSKNIISPNKAAATVIIAEMKYPESKLLYIMLRTSDFVLTAMWQIIAGIIELCLSVI